MNQTNLQTVKKILLVDGNNYLYRIYFALNKVLKTNNENLILHSLIFNLEKLLKKLAIDHCFFAFDFKKTTFRNEMYLDYKKDRPKMPEKLFHNMQIFEEYLKTRNISVYKKENYEADDVIASLISKLYQKNWIFYILSSDLDICQLIQENVIFLNISKKILSPDFWTKEKFFEKFSFYPEHIVDFKAIVGDPSDNIKGIKQIGAKSATNLLNKFNSIENIFLNLNQLPAKYQNIFALKENQEIAKNNQKIICLVNNLYTNEQTSEKTILKNLKITSELVAFLTKHQLKKIAAFFGDFQDS